MGVEAGEELDGGDDGAGGQGDFGQRYDGDEDAHNYGEGPGIARGLKQVGSDLGHDAVAEHEDPSYCRCTVQEVLTMCKHELPKARVSDSQ